MIIKFKEESKDNTTKFISKIQKNLFKSTDPKFKKLKLFKDFYNENASNEPKDGYLIWMILLFCNNDRESSVRLKESSYNLINTIPLEIKTGSYETEIEIVNDFGEVHDNLIWAPSEGFSVYTLNNKLIIENSSDRVQYVAIDDETKSITKKMITVDGDYFESSVIRQWLATFFEFVSSYAVRRLSDYYDKTPSSNSRLFLDNLTPCFTLERRNELLDKFFIQHPKLINVRHFGYIAQHYSDVSLRNDCVEMHKSYLDLDYDDNKILMERRKGLEQQIKIAREKREQDLLLEEKNKSESLIKNEISTK